MTGSLRDSQKPIFIRAKCQLELSEDEIMVLAAALTALLQALDDSEIEAKPGASRDEVEAILQDLHTFLRRFLKKNVLIQDVGTGWIKMSYLGNAGWRSKRASTAGIAALPSVMPFW
jgi:hypothetical protein